MLAVHRPTGLPHPSLQLPLAGVYCDGEIGPAILNAKSALRWAGEAGGSALQGSSTILTALVGTR